MLKSPSGATSPRVPSPEHIRPPRAGDCRLLRPPCWDPHSGKGRRAAEVGSCAGRTVQTGAWRAEPAGELQSSRFLPSSPVLAGVRLAAAASRVEPGGSQLGWGGGAAVSRPRTAPQGASVVRVLHRAGHVPVCLKWRLGWLWSQGLHSAGVGSADLRRQDGDTRKPKASERTWRVRFP